MKLADVGRVVHLGLVQAVRAADGHRRAVRIDVAGRLRAERRVVDDRAGRADQPVLRGGRILHDEPVGRRVPDHHVRAGPAVRVPKLPRLRALMLSPLTVMLSNSVPVAQRWCGPESLSALLATELWKTCGPGGRVLLLTKSCRPLLACEFVTKSSWPLKSNVYRRSPVTMLFGIEIDRVVDRHPLRRRVADDGRIAEVLRRRVPHPHVLSVRDRNKFPGVVLVGDRRRNPTRPAGSRRRRFRSGPTTSSV